MARLYATYLEKGKSRYVPLAVTLDENGLGILKVDTEISVDGASFNIDNLFVASTDGTIGNAKYIKVDADGTVHTSVTLPDILNVDENPLKKANITAEYTYVTSGNGIGKVETIKEYLSGAVGGQPAKLSTYEYNISNKVSKITITDTTV